MNPDPAFVTEVPGPIKTQFKTVTVAELLDKELPPRENVLAPWLPCQGLAMIHAPRGVGKTHIALGIAYAVACGGIFLKWQSMKPRNVLIIDGEMPAVVLQERLASIIKSGETEPQAEIQIITPDFQPGRMPDLSSEADQTELGFVIEDKELIIVDNISTLCRTGRENEAEGWLPVQEWALRMRAAGKSVLFIHHSGKGGGQRGTSRREDILDTVINLRRANDYKHEDGAEFEVHFEKARGIYGDDVAPFVAQLSTDEHGVQCWLTQSLEDSTYEKVIVLHKEGLTQKEIAEELGRNKSTISRHVNKAKMEGLIND